MPPTASSLSRWRSGRRRSSTLMAEYFWQGDPSTSSGQALVRLRAVEPEDWETFHTWNFDSDSARLGYGLPFPQSKDAAKSWAAQEANKQPENDAFRFVIEENMSG